MFPSPFQFIIWATLTEILCSASSVSLELEHSFDSGHSFQPFRQLILRPTTGVLTLSALNSQSGYNPDKETLMRLAQSGDLYTLRINVTDTDSLESSVLMCQLLTSQMKLNLVISLNDQGFPVAVTISPPRYECLPVEALSNQLSSTPTEISFKLDVQKPVIGSTPETIKYLQRLEKQREEMARAEKGDNRSFFAKYWTYIVPALIIFIIFSSVQDAQSSGGRQ